MCTRLTKSVKLIIHKAYMSMLSNISVLPSQSEYQKKKTGYM